jgi:hypothetical protein
MEEHEYYANDNNFNRAGWRGKERFEDIVEGHHVRSFMGERNLNRKYEYDPSKEKAKSLDEIFGPVETNSQGQVVYKFNPSFL